MVTERKGGIKVTAANQSAENGHMLIDGNDIALFKIAFDVSVYPLRIASVASQVYTCWLFLPWYRWEIF